MKDARFRGSGMIVICALLLTGCGGGAGNAHPVKGPPPESNTGTAARSSESPSVSSRQSERPGSGAPKIEDPLPASILSGSPCDALTSEQLVDIFGAKYSDGNPRESGPGPTCSWSDLDSGSMISIYYQTKIDGGLSLAYQNVKPDAARWVELNPVRGYPAVGYVSVNAAGGTDTGCYVVVGIRNQLTYAVAISLADTAIGETDPCVAGRKVAVMVMDNFLEKLN